jgi:hypothetical protein
MDEVAHHDLEDINGLPHPDGRNVLFEYREPLSWISVMPSIMEQSRSALIVTHLSQCLKDTPLPAFNAEEIIFCRAIRRAFALEDACDVLRYRCAIAVVDCQRCCVYDDVFHFYSSLSWERPLLLVALRELSSIEDSTGMQIVVGLMVRASSACSARRRASFSSIINRVPLPREASPNVVTLLHSVLHDAPADVQHAALRVRAACVAYIDEVKWTVFESTFLQPTFLMFHLLHIDDMDIDVHGASVYLALLQYTTGIHTDRIPDLDDEVKAVVDFLAVPGARPLLDDLWRGRPRDALKMTERISAISTTRFIWNAHYTRELVSMALSSDLENVERRRRWAEYLTLYCKKFSDVELFPHLFQACIGSTSMSEECSTLVDDASVVARFLCKDREELIDVRQWVWNIDEFPPVFSMENALVLLSAIGVAKPRGWQLQAACTALLQPPPVGTRRYIPASSISLHAAGDVRGGGTGREFLSNLLRDGTEPWNKWLHPGFVETTWIEARFDQTFTICGYGLCSANDAPHRDPIAWTVLGRATAEEEWKPIHFVGETMSGPFSFRWQWKWFPIEPSAVVAVRIEFHAVRNAGDGCQLGHLKFVQQ